MTKTKEQMKVDAREKYIAIMSPALEKYKSLTAPANKEYHTIIDPAHNNYIKELERINDLLDDDEIIVDWKKYKLIT